MRAAVSRMLAADTDTSEWMAEMPVIPCSGLLDSGPSGREGDQIGVYRIMRELGRGGMGAVYLAERADVGKRVALKLVRGGRAALEHRERFAREQRVLARLDHPHIASLVDAGVAVDGTPYFAMELVEGERLDVFCDTRQLTIAERLALFAQVCGAVQFAHQNRVVHRDLKPSNILVNASSATDRPGRVKLLDFGIAKLLEREAKAAGETRVDAPLMTPEYAAPEQLRSEPVTAATDVYALGVVLYELVSGHRPYPADAASAGEWEQRVLRTVPARPSSVVTQPANVGQPDGSRRQLDAGAISAARSTSPVALRRALRGDLDTIILKALEKEPARRYLSAQQLLDDVDRFRHGRPIAARPATRSYRARKFVGRHRFGVAAAAIVALLTVGTGLAVALQQTAAARAIREADRAEQAIDLLVQLIDASDPKQTPGSLLSAPTVLEWGEHGVDALGRFPDMQAQVLTRIGEAYVGLGQYRRATTVLERALTIRQRLYSGDHPDLATSLWWLGIMRTDRARFDEAENLLRESLSMRRRLLAPGHIRVIESVLGLAFSITQRGDFVRAERYMREALALSPEGLNGARSITPEPAMGVGSVLMQQGRFVEAEALLRAGYAAELARSGADHPWSFMALTILAQNLHGQGRLDEAEAAFREVIERAVRVQSERHPRFASYLQLYAALRLDQGDAGTAEVFARRALDLQLRSLGAGHHWTVPTLVTLGRTLTETGRAAEAEPLLREAVAIAEQRLPAHPHLAHARSELGATLVALDRITEAEPLLAASYAALRDALGDEYPLTRQARARLEQLHLRGLAGS